MPMHSMQRLQDQMMIGKNKMSTTYLFIVLTDYAYHALFTNLCFRYWLYAAIKFKCLIVTNDEMRDHLFQLLGNDFFPKWKERHQVSKALWNGSFSIRSLFLLSCWLYIFDEIRSNLLSLI